MKLNYTSYYLNPKNTSKKILKAFHSEDSYFGMKFFISYDCKALTINLKFP